MPLWKKLRLFAYYHATLPARYGRNRLLARRGNAPVMVLIYHRVADDWANGWTTRTDVFVKQIRWLQRHFEFVSLEEAQRRIRAKSNHRLSVSITFDDGYASNCRTALPLLIKERIPTTYFVTSDCVLKRKPFEHDLKMGNHFEPNTLEQLREMAKAGIEIGAHTRTHADLGRVQDPRILCDEVITAGEELQAALGASIRYFAFPFGQHANLSAEAFHLADEAGYEAVCSAYGGYNFPGDDAFHLQRIGADGPLSYVKNWTTVDPVKQLRIKRYFYPPATVPRSESEVPQP
jgi:peptidoglycan/xylan/chitin deacetylase (PgdA/CDA1 family)